MDAHHSATEGASSHHFEPTPQEQAHHEHAPDTGPEVVSEQTQWWALAGIILGAALGAMFGMLLAYERLAIPKLAPIVAGGTAVAMFTGASFFASLFGLFGGLVGIRHDTPSMSKLPDSQNHSGSDKTMHSSWIQQLPPYGALVLALFMAYSLYVIASRAIGAGMPSDQGNRLHWHLKNATRVGGNTDVETAPAALSIAYPSTRLENRPTFVLSVPTDWRIALAATSLIARPVNGAVLIAGTVRPVDVERLTNTVSPAVSNSITDSARNLLALSDDVYETAARIDAALAKFTGRVSSNIIAVAADGDPRWALPAAAYAARTATPIVFVGLHAMPPATATALERRSGHANIFVLGPRSVVSDAVLTHLSQYGRVTRISVPTPELNAIRFAEFRNDSSAFGWGHTGRGPRRFGSTNAIIVDEARWQDAIAAAHLARTGKSGPLLLTTSGRLPASVDTYLWRQRPAFANTPAEGPFNHAWIVGSFDRIPYTTQAWADYALEIEQYMTLGDSALSALESLALAWILASIASAIWIVIHARRHVGGILPMMIAAWSLFALLLGPIALVLYVKSYNRRPAMVHDGMVMWHRPMWAQVVSATVMMFGFDMMLMVLAVFLLAYIGFPIILSGASLYILGSAMFLMMILMYLIALIIMMLVFHTPMTMHERKISSYWKAFAVGFPLMIATMTVESLGMMPTMWWAQMSFLPGMQMPTEDEFTMWATLLIAAVVGFLVVLPWNYRLVKRGRKMGTM